jgi:hypothetical protein
MGGGQLGYFLPFDKLRDRDRILDTPCDKLRDRDRILDTPCDKLRDPVSIPFSSFYKP